MRLPEYYAWDNRVIVSRSVVRLSVKKWSLLADVNEEVTKMPKEPRDGVSETKGTALRVTKIDVAHYHHENMLLRVN